MRSSAACHACNGTLLTNVKRNPVHLSSFVDPVALGHKHRFQEWLEMRDLLRVELNEPDLLYLDGAFET